MGYMFKMVTVLLASVGVGFGVKEVVTNDFDMMNDDTTGQEFYHMGYGGNCDFDEDFIGHITEGLSVEDQLLVTSKIDELLLEFDTTLVDLDNDFTLRHDFMFALMTYLDEVGIDHQNESGYEYHGMGGMH